MAFVITGLFGFFWLALWHYRYTPKKPEYAPNNIDEDDLDKKLTWTSYFKHKEVWGIALSRFVSDGVFYFFLFWIPSYLVDERGFDLFQIGMFAWIPFLAADLGSISGGWVGTYLMNQGRSLDQSRKIVMWIGAILVLPILFCLKAQSSTLAIALISLALFSTQFKQSSLFTIPIDIFDDKNAASVWGISGSAGSFGAMLFTPLIGWMIDNISYSPVFIIVSFLHVLSVIIIILFIPEIRKINLKHSIN